MRPAKLPKTLAFRLLLPIVLGVAFAAAFTSIQYECADQLGAQGCVTYEKALLHPHDLFANKQDSLERGLTSFFAVSLLALLVVNGFARIMHQSDRLF